MKHFVLTDEFGLILSETWAEQALAGNWTELDPDLHPGGVVRGTRRRLIDGVVVDTGQPLVPPPGGYVWSNDSMTWAKSATLAAVVARERRNQLLLESDWTDTASALARLGQSLYDQWQTYRQELRDVSSQTGFPLDIVWPTAP